MALRGYSSKLLTANETKQYFLHSNEDFSNLDDNLFNNMYKSNKNTNIEDIDISNTVCKDMLKTLSLVAVCAISAHTLPQEVCYYSLGKLRPISLFFFIHI